MSHKPTKPVDWPAIEIAYRAGIRSLRSIGKEFVVSNVAILKRAKRDGWTRDLSARIEAEANARLASKLAVSTKALTEVSKEQADTERGVVNAVAELRALTLTEHHENSRALRRTIVAQIEELGLHGNPAVQEGLQLLAIGKASQEGSAEAMRAMTKALDAALTLPGRAIVAHKLASALSSAIEEERRALGIQEIEEKGEHESYIDFLNSLPSPEEHRRLMEQRERENPQPWKALPNAH